MPASIFDMSRMSFSIASSDVPEFIEKRGQPTLRRVERPVQEQGRKSDDSVHGSADLVAHRRQKGGLGAVCRLRLDHGRLHDLVGVRPLGDVPDGRGHQRAVPGVRSGLRLISTGNSLPSLRRP